MVGTRDEKILVLHPENLSINLGSVLLNIKYILKH